MGILRAYADRRGVIGLAPSNVDVPRGVMIFARGRGKAFRAKVEVRARHAYDGKTFLVPGVPEARNDFEAFDAFRRWQAWAFPYDPAISLFEIAP